MSLSSLFDDVAFPTEAIARPNPVAASFKQVAEAVLQWRAERSRDVALRELLALEPHRLDDLGISRDQIFVALRHDTGN